jgi:DNA polymerase-3 subunit delta'
MATTETPIEDPVRPSATPWQRDLVQRLVDLRQRNGLAHALLINPRTAVDSREFGWYLASALMCRAESANAPCGECRPCRLMRANTYPDFSFTTLVDNERTHKLNRDIKINQIRQLIHRLSLTASDSVGKYALVYPAERMNQNAANSLLKTLEEPATGVTLILLSHTPGRLPVTIRSRCQRWTVDSPAADEADAWLAGEGLSQDARGDYLGLANGDAQLAAELHSQQALEHLNALQQAIREYLGGRSSVMAVSASVKGLDDDLLRRLVRRILRSFIDQQLQREPSQAGRSRLASLLDLVHKADFVLQSQETNLILHLQLEDVLISLKQILLGENHHGRTRQPGHTVT